MNKFEEWIKKNRNYDVTIEEYVSTAGVTNLYIDDKFLLTRNDNLQSIMYGATSTELCLAFPTDKEIGFKNPIEEFLENFFIYGFHFIENSKKMYQTELLGVTAFKIRKDNKPELRFWPPIQGMGDDLYYYDLKKCILNENMNKDFLEIPSEMWDIFYGDLKEQREINNELLG